ncbi:hypothetical protein IU451_29260 [Nocardia cyriacigeorgica]|uniref:hypothetical protein n=1 Tax=Nocardia cyriacigeorgica TaxID=135487 RepID=UPI0018940CD3|nr:hypothetical protein [Nocardia cyriacigeorgica]MBF6326590.1 hypothetical protein [Nocardia cyriacigeorgica]
MAAAKKTTAGAALKKAAAKSRFAELRDQARANRKVTEPYMFDGTEPPTPILPPDTVDQVTAVAQILDRDGDFDIADTRKLFAIICGEAFPAVWSSIKDEPLELMFLLVNDINDHFNMVPEDDDLPGGD